MSKAPRFGASGFVILLTGAVLGAASVIPADASSTRTRTAACPRLANAAALPRWRPGGLLVGDVDGDGVADDVGIRYSRNSLASCGFLLVVNTHRALLATRIREADEEGATVIRDWRPTDGDPYLAAIVRLTPDREQIVVSRWHGASVANVSLYGLAGPGLAQLHFRPRVYRDELSLFGSVGTGQTYARCSRGGPLMLLGMGPTGAGGRRWLVVRSEYRLSERRFERTRSRTIRTSPQGALRVADRWGASALPFTGCTVARGRRL